MSSYYEINVALNGRHFFATAPRSLRDEEEARKAYEEIVKRFPAAEGFDVSCTHWQCQGNGVQF